MNLKPEIPLQSEFGVHASGFARLLQSPLKHAYDKILVDRQLKAAPENIKKRLRGL
jgi:hypothetical protein